MRSIGRLVVNHCKSDHTHSMRVNLLTSLFTTLPGTRVADAIVVRAVAGIDYSEVYEEKSQSLEKYRYKHEDRPGLSAVALATATKPTKARI